MEDGKDCTMVIFNMRMPRWELKELQQAAGKDKRSASSFVRKAIAEKKERMQ